MKELVNTEAGRSATKDPEGRASGLETVGVSGRAPDAKLCGLEAVEPRLLLVGTSAGTGSKGISSTWTISLF